MIKNIATLLLLWIAAQQAHAFVSACVELAASDTHSHQHIVYNTTGEDTHDHTKVNASHNDCENADNCCAGLCHSVASADYQFAPPSTAKSDKSSAGQMQPELIVYAAIIPPKFA